MDDEELLAVLKSEMLLTEARAQGARHAYESKSVLIAWNECDFGRGNTIIIKFSDGERAAEFDKVEWSEYDFRGYKGPALYGWIILKSGKKSKFRQALCTIDMLRAGHVLLAPKK